MSSSVFLLCLVANTLLWMCAFTALCTPADSSVIPVFITAWASFTVKPSALWIWSGKILSFTQRSPRAADALCTADNATSPEGNLTVLLLWWMEQRGLLSMDSRLLRAAGTFRFHSSQDILSLVLQLDWFRKLWKSVNLTGGKHMMLLSSRAVVLCCQLHLLLSHPCCRGTEELCTRCWLNLGQKEAANACQHSGGCVGPRSC